MNIFHFKIIFLFAFFGVFLHINSFAQWNQIQTPTKENLFSLEHISNGNLIAVGAKGSIISSSDSGFTWVSNAYSGFENLRAIQFENENNGVVCGENALILKTQNKGVSWSIKHSLSGKYLNDIILNDTYGLAVGRQGYILESIDNGETWTQVQSRTTHTFYSLSQLSTNLYFVGADSGYLYKWEPSLQKLTQNKLETNLRINKLQYMGDGVMIASGGNPDTLFTNANENFLAVSYDTGNTWIYSNYMQARQFNKSYFLNEDTGYFAMPSGRIGHTFDQGKSFNAHYIGNPININDIYFFNSTFGICLADVGRVYITENAGGFALSKPQINQSNEEYLRITNPTSNNLLHYKSKIEGFLNIYSIDGRFCKVIHINEGETKIHLLLNEGMYFYQFISESKNDISLKGILIVEN